MTWLRFETPVFLKAPNWRAFYACKAIQLSLAWSLFVGFSFPLAVIVVFVLDFLDGSFISGRIGKPFDRGLYAEYRDRDWAFDFIVYLPLMWYAAGLYPVLLPFFAVWFLAFLPFCIAALRISEVLAFKPPSAFLLVLALFGLPLVALAIALNPLLEWYIHSDKWRLKGVRKFLLVTTACSVWATFAHLAGLSISPLLALLIMLPP